MITLQPTYDVTSNLSTANQAADEKLQRAVRLRAQVDATAAEISSLEPTVNRLAAELADRQTERALADDSEAKRLDAEIKKLTAEHDSKSRELNRARALLEGLEAKAPEVDDEIRIAATELQAEVSIWIGDSVHTLAEELQQAVQPLLGVMAKARALKAAGSEQLRDFLLAAYVPNPEHFIRLAGADPRGGGANLLDLNATADQADAAQGITDALGPVLRTLAAAKSHPAYVPIAKRPKPYVRRGYTTEGLRGDQAPFGEAQARSPQARVVTPADLGRPLPPSTGRIRTGYAGDLPPGTPTDGNVGPALVDQLMRGDSFAI